MCSLATYPACAAAVSLGARILPCLYAQATGAKQAPHVEWSQAWAAGVRDWEVHSYEPVRQKMNPSRSKHQLELLLPVVGLPGQEASGCSVWGFSSLCPGCTRGCAGEEWPFVPV